MAYELWLLTLTLSYDFWVQAPKKWAKQLSKCLLWGFSFCVSHVTSLDPKILLPIDFHMERHVFNLLYNLLSGKSTTYIHLFINH